MLNKINILISFVFCFISLLFTIINKDITILLFSLVVIIPFILKLKPIVTFLYLIFSFDSSHQERRRICIRVICDHSRLDKSENMT